MDAAIRAREGSFDGVEIHSGYGGYLIAHFLSPHANRRDDEWGGPLENGIRLLKEVIKRVRRAVGEDFVVGMQLAGDEFTLGGITLDDSKVIAREIEHSCAVDYMTVKAGSHYSYNNIVPDVQHPHGVYLPLAAGIRGEMERLPHFDVGRIISPLLAESVIADGYADIVAMTRTHVADPEIMTNVKEGRMDDIRECIRCNQRVLRNSA